MAKKSQAKASVRSATEVRIEKCSWDLWAYVRENSQSLDAERARGIIVAALNEVVQETLAEADALKAEADALKADSALLHGILLLIAKKTGQEEKTKNGKKTKNKKAK